MRFSLTPSSPMTQPTRWPPIEVELLVRHLAGQATPVETAAVEQWLAARPENRETLAALRDALGAEPQIVEPSDTNAVWQRLAPHLTDTAPVKLVRTADAAEWPLARRRSWLPAAVAATIAIAAGVGVWRIAQSPDARSATEAPARVVTTARAERVSLRLADGSLVTLAPSSTLRISPTYGDGSRRVDLEGEAAFTVIHDATRPFVVHTAHAEARDLGTRFVVRAYPGDSTADVAVAEGLVSVHGASAPASDSLLLTPNDVARVEAGGQMRRLRGAALEPYFAWVDGRIVFRDTPLREAAVRLARWYDIDIRVASDDIGALPLTASFMEHPAPEALRLVAVTLDLRLSRDGRVYTLARK